MEVFGQLFAAFTGTIAFSVLFSVPRRYCLYCGLTGSVGWGVYLAVNYYYHAPVIGTFFASMVLTFISRYLSVQCKAPTILFLLCGIFTLVPGAGIYYTAYYMFANAGSEALMKGFESIKLAVAIALGIGVVYSTPAKVFGWKIHKEIK